MKTKFSFYFNILDRENLNSKTIAVLKIGENITYLAGIICYIPVKSRVSKEQPRLVMYGFANKIEIIDGVCYIL